jgi:DNA-binding HxlR family transcriptional regulator
LSNRGGKIGNEISFTIEFSSVSSDHPEVSKEAETSETLKPHNCKIGIEECLQINTGKWKPIILPQLQLEGTQRFSYLKRGIPGITQKMLTAQLKELEQEKMVRRVVFP